MRKTGTSLRKAITNVTIDQDLLEYARAYAKEQRINLSEMFNLFLLNLKRTKQGDPTETILADPDFEKSLLQTISKIRSGTVKWSKYKEVF